VIFSLSVLVFLWAVINFLFWQKNEIPKTSDRVVTELKRHRLEPILLSSQLLDHMVLEHPELNIYPAGGEAYLNAGSPTDFILLEGFESKDCDDFNEKLETQELFSYSGYSIKKCLLKGSKIIEMRASSFIDKFIVTVPPSENEKKFLRGRFKTGRNGWQKIETGLGEFGELKKLAISAHPLSGKKTIKIGIPSIDKPDTEAFIGLGIANSGKKGGSKPVKLTITQGENIFEVFSKDGIWQEKRIPKFDPLSPLTIEIRVEDSGKRHFFFDVRYEINR
jgi:hypothetical protein